MAVLILAHGLPMLLKIDFAALVRSAGIGAGSAYAPGELGGEAVLDGGAGLVVRGLALQAYLPGTRSTATSPA